MSNPEGELVLPDPRENVGYPYCQFGDPEDVGYTPERRQRLVERARLRESEA